jgi:hypothetical protein
LEYYNAKQYLYTSRNIKLNPRNRNSLYTYFSFESICRVMGNNMAAALVSCRGVPLEVVNKQTICADDSLWYVSLPNIFHWLTRGPVPLCVSLGHNNVVEEGEEAAALHLYRFPREASLIALMMEAAQTSETSVKSYQSTRHYNPEGSHLHSHRRENFKSY